MKKMWKRFVSLLLACTLLAGMLPLSASAASEPTEMTEWLQKKVEEIQATVPEGSQEYTKHGPFRIGDSELYQYTLMRSFVDDEGSSASDTIILILPGVNAENTSLPDYKNAMDDQPWEESFPSQIYIAEGVTGIGNYTFANNNNLKKVVFQDASDLTYVGSYAFNGDSRAQFTDEGNIDEKTTLNLSNVTKMGENAFYNCDGIKGVELSGSIIAVETNEEGGTEDINNKIPNHAFGSCNALTSITVPEGITTIGTAAFAGCTQASSITLPDSLVTIGDRAFACSIDGDNKQLTALTIPENVETIGASAFYGYTALTTVTVESTVLEKPGDAAFGDNEMSAYSGPQTVGDVTVQNGGTTFKTPNAAITELFVNHENCYLGPISPLTLIEKESYPAMCNKAGKNVYKYTFNNVDKRLEETLSPLQPHFTGTKTIPATCRQPAYYEKTCDQWFEKDKKTGKWVRTTHIHNEAIPVGGDGYEEAKGHAYEVTAISNEGHITEAGGSRVTFVCQNTCHDETRDGSQKTVNLTLTLTQQEATTLQKLSDITLPALTNGTLEWNEPNTELDFDEDVQYFPVTFTPNQQSYGYLVKDGQLVEASECGGIQLTVGVKVEKVELDFSRIAFDNASNLILPGSDARTPITIRNAPEEVGEPTKILYTKTGEDASSEEPPVRGEEWSGTVSVTYSYNSKDYKIDENTDFEFGTKDNPYTIEVDEGTNGQGTVTISHRYEIIPGTWEDVEATAINPTYDAVDMKTVHLQGVPGGATITWQYKHKDADDSTYSPVQTVEMPSGGGNSIDIAPIETAGDYTVKIQISYAGYKPENWGTTVDVHVYKKAVPIPTAVTGLTYTGKPQTGVSVAAGMNDIYTLSGNTETDATGYTATATLTDEAFPNYCWQGRGEEQKTAEISWSIAKRSVMVPNVFQTREYQYNGEYQKIVSAPNGTKFEYVFPTEGTEVQGKFKESGIVAFTVTNGQAKDVGEYPITATLANGNYQWVGTGNPADGSLSVDLGEWEITPIYLTAPAFTANGKEYDGQPYAPDTLVQWQDGTQAQAVAKVQEEMKGSDQFTFSRFVYNSGGATAPKDAGSYTIQAEYTYPTQNYVLQNNTSRNFTIKQKSLTMQAPGNQKLTYTGASHEIQGVIVNPSGLVEGDDEKAYVITYSSQEWDETLNAGEGGWSSSTTTYEGLPSLEHVGRYLITAKLTSRNYTAEDVTYEVEISIATQTVKLTQEGGTEVADGGSISKTLGNDPFTVTGKGYVNDVVVNENNIHYEVTGGDPQNPVVKVDANSGQVTLLRAGSATITVTAAGSANYQAATASYTITVDKGMPEVAVQMPGGGAGNTYSYTGKELGFGATVTGAPDAVEPVKEEKVSFKFYQDDNDSKGEVISGDQPTGIGTYWVEAVYEGDDNYNEATSTAEKFTISPAALNVTATGYTDTYNGGEHDPVKSITVKGVGGVISSGYTISYAKKTDDQPPEAGSSEWKKDFKVKDVADSGDYWIKVVINGDDSSYAPYVGEEPITVTINPRPLEIERKVTARKPYDGTKKATVNIGELETGVTGEEINVTDTHAEYNSAEVDASSITITYTLKAGENTNLANYTVSTDGGKITDGLGTETVTTVDGTQVGIDPAPITVAISDQEKVYDGRVATPSQSEWSVDEEKLYDVDGDGTKDNLDITLSIDSDSDAKNAGAYAIIGEADNKNYKVTFTGNWKGEEGDPNNDHAGTYTIDPRPIDVKIGDAEGFYGDAPVLTGVELTYEGTDEENHRGLAPGENSVPNITLGTGASAQSPVAGYVIYAVDGSNEQIQKDTPEVIGNYKVTFTQNGTYTVNPRPITITIKDHSSKYGAAIDDGIADPVSGTNYTVAITAGNTVTDGAIVNGDDLGIALSTTAEKGDNAGTYPISGEAKAEPSVVSNYAITWKGENPFIGEGEPDSTKATYTVEKAELTVEAKQPAVYAQYGQETANPLTFTNASTGEEITVDDSNYETLENAVTYTLNPADSLTMETENKAEGKFTVNVTDTTVTVEVNVAETDNFKAATKITYDVYTSASGSLTVDLPFADLTYTSEGQKLLTGAPTLPDGVVIRYKLGEKGTWTKYSDEAPNNWQSLVGTDAGDYTVYWETKAGGNYNASSGHETTEIKKADLSATYTGLNGSEVTLVLSEMGDTYTIPLDLTGNKGYTHSNGDGVTFLSGNTDVAIAKNSTATLELRGVAGEAKITINCPGDNNYNPGTFTFTVTVTDQKAEILYNVTGITTTYNGQPQTIKVEVTEPDSGATVMYWNEETKAYDLSEPPAYTDVQDGGYPIKFQITAPGYEIEEGTATLKIEPKDISQCRVEGIAESYTFVNKPIEPQTVEVVDGSVILTKDKDYTIDYGENTEIGEDEGFVTITGKGNYKGSVKKNFTISPVDASDLTASLNRTFGYYGDSETNNATVTVTHGSHTVTSDGSNTVSVAVTQFNGAAATDKATVSGQTVTFNQVGTYTIEVTVTGNHATNAPIQLTYALLPVEEGELVLKADNETSVVATYGNAVNGTITVTDANGTPMTESTDYTLAYTYTPFEGTAQGSKPYDPSVMSGTPAAGMYVVTATGQGGYANSVGTFTFLILQRDLSEANLTVEDSGLVYNQNAQTPSVTVTVDGNAQPTKDTDYTITYYNNVNASNAAKAVVTATGNNFTGSKTADFTIAPKPITECVVEKILDQFYTGEPVIPPVTITDGVYPLILGYDYTTACEDKGPGAATVTIKGTGNYTETTTKDFVIKSEGAPEPSERFDLVVTPSQWTWGDDLTNLDLSVTFGTDKELTLGTEYTLSINNEVYGDAAGETKEQAIEAIKSLKPDEYTITATGMDAYAGSTDTETVTIQKIQPTVTVKATPNSLSGGGKVTLTLKGEKLPAFAKGEDLSDLLTVTVQNGQQAPDLKELEWTENQDGSLTAELTLPNTNETYTFALRFVGNDCYESASSNAMVVVGQQTSGGGGGSDPGDQPADPDDTGVSDWLNTKDHLAYLAGYPGGTFGPDQNMTRAEAAQMFYNLLLEKDVEITVEFEDVPADAWYAKPVNTLASLGILSGVGNGRFDPERSITRAEFTVIAMKFANTSGGGVNIFSDVNEDDWFYSAVVDSTQYGWINGYPDGTFRPEATISRAEVTVIVNHMLGRAADRPYVIAHEEELNTFGDVNRGHWGYFHVAEATNAHEYHTEDGTESWTGLS